MEKISTRKIEDFTEGQAFSLSKTIKEEDVNDFSSLSGDICPLHMSEQFAIKRGFKGRVAHGALLMSYVSQLIGVYFPGENCLLQSLSFKFLLPAYINDAIEINAVIDQISLSMKVLVLNVRIETEESHNLLVKGKVQVGFTNIMD
jgi:3-hydroxybutyryl-CoA dehydratase